MENRLCMRFQKTLAHSHFTARCGAFKYPISIVFHRWVFHLKEHNPATTVGPHDYENPMETVQCKFERQPERGLAILSQIEASWNMSMYVNTLIWIQARYCTHVYRYVYIYIHIYHFYQCIYIYMYIYIHIYICIYIHTYTYIHHVYIYIYMISIYWIYIYIYIYT